MKPSPSLPRKAIAEIAAVVTGGTPSTRNKLFWDGDVPWLNSGALNGGDVRTPSRYITQEGLRHSAAKLMPPDTVLIALTGATTGQVGYLHFESAANQSVTGILPSHKHNPRYLFHFLRTQRERIKGAAFGAAQPHINQQYVKDILVPLPPLPEQKRIAAILDAADALRAKRRESIEQLDSLTQATFLEMFGDPVANPKGWNTLTIGDVTSLVTYGLTVRPQYHPSGVPLISASQIRSGVIDHDAAPKISTLDFDALRPKCKATAGDVLFSKTGTIGHVAAVASTESIAIAQNVARLTPKPTVIHSKWFVVYLRSQSIQALAVRMAKGNAQKDLQLGDLAAFVVPTPPLSLQTRFASIVESIEQQKARLKAHVAELDTLFASLQSRAFNGELVA